jgi:large conductance mechanosensitive channel
VSESKTSNFSLTKMPGDYGHRLLNSSQRASKGVSRFWGEFKSFLFEGSIVEVAIGVMIAASFGAVVNSFIDNMISPFLGLVAAKNLDHAYLPIKCPDTLEISCTDILSITKTYPTVASAQAAGIVTWNYGAFIEDLLNFLIKGFILFMNVKMIAAASLKKTKEKAATERECFYCCTMIPIKALKCGYCGSDIDKSVV